MINDVAIYKDGVVYVLPRPNRHCDLISMMCNKYGFEEVVECEQGFLSASGVFLNREEALGYAKAAGQITEPKYQPNRLFSEDLW